MCTIAASTAKTEGVPTAFLIVCLLLLTLAAHGSGVFNGFVPYDDNVYVYDNPHVRAGLTLDGVIWAFHALQGGNWNPLVWLSHMFVVSVAGPNPLGQHLFNLLLHCGNVVLFFLLLQAATGARIRSLLAAALFAVHPVHVESVAWIAERKDVLSMLFGMLALQRVCSLRPYLQPIVAHGRVFFLLLLGLMAKAMAGNIAAAVSVDGFLAFESPWEGLGRSIAASCQKTGSGKAQLSDALRVSLAW